MILGVVVFVVGIFVMIFVHELGHYLTAKRYGIKVDEFFLGFGPRVWSFRRGETEYGIKAIPLGGYVRIAGMNPFEEVAPEDRDRVFTAKPKRQRAVVLVAGAATHFVLAFLLLLTFSWFVGLPIVGGAQVAAVEPTLDGRPSPASEAGLRPGDRFLEYDGRPVEDYEEFLEYIDAHAGQQITLVIERDGERLTTTASPRLSRSGTEVSGRLGIAVTQAVVGRDRLGPLQGVKAAAIGHGPLPGITDLVGGSFQAIGRVFGPEGIGRLGEVLFGGSERSIEDPVGIVGAARVSGQAVQSGQLEAFILLFAFFNVFVGILNVLPLPPLDGGHLAVLGVEAVTGKPVDPRRLIPISAVVAGFLILFTVSLLYLDLVEPIPNPFR